MRRMEGEAILRHASLAVTSGRSISSGNISFKQVNPEEVES